MILKLGGYDMVIGLDPLRQLGPVTFNFDEQSISFQRGGKTVTLNGIKPEMSLTMMVAKQFKRAYNKGQGSYIWLFVCDHRRKNGRKK